MSDIKFNAKDGDIIQTIQDSVKTEKIEVAPGDFVTREVYRVPKKELAAALVIASLSGLTTYLTDKVDVNTRKGIFVHVDSPTKVYVRNVIQDDEDRRFTPLEAKADVPRLDFDQFIKQEEMVIALQCRFVDTPERAALLESLGNMVADEELQQEDDGVSQTVTTQKGINRSLSKIKNPVPLRPFRTFTEVEQPESPFIVRLRKSDSGILVGLFEADGGAWRNTARQSIKEYIEKSLEKDSGIPVIA